MMKSEVGVLPWIALSNRRVALVLVTSRSGKRWLWPKGHHETNLADRKVAALEAYEEAGVLGKVDRKEILTFRYQHKGKVIEQHLYCLEVSKLLSRWPEFRQRKRRIVTLERACQRVQPTELAAVLQQIAKRKNWR